MPSSIAEKTLLDFYSFSHSHLYWGRKPFAGLQRILEDLRPGGTFLDPFCGSGSALVTALAKGARVIGSDLNPMAVFMSTAIIQPISLYSLKCTFHGIKKSVSESILNRYKIACTTCQRRAFFNYLQWNKKTDADFPESVKFVCKDCGASQLRELTKNETEQQVTLSHVQPAFWIPKCQIRTRRIPSVRYFHELFTGRNLSALSELFNAVEEVNPLRVRQVFYYVFTAMLYSCSQMQMFSKKSPESSRGWTAPRYYLPPARMEKNVWKVFENRFKNVLKCKENLNSILGGITISDTLERFETSTDNLYIHQSDYLSFPFPERSGVDCVYLDPPYNDDVDYLGFSEFWGSWLRMRFSTQKSWQPGQLTIEENADKIRKLLLRIRENTNRHCKVILAYGSKRKKAWPSVENAICEAGYGIQEKSPIFLDNSQKRKSESHEFGAVDQYLVLRRQVSRPVALKDDALLKSSSHPAQEDRELRFYCRIAAYLLSSLNGKTIKLGKTRNERISNLEKIRETASELVRPALREKLAKIKETDVIDKWTNENQLNQKAYNVLCLHLLNNILEEDSYKIIAIDKDKFSSSDLSFYFNLGAFLELIKIKGADFEAIRNSNDNGRRLVFSFFTKEGEKIDRKIAQQVRDLDKDNFQLMYFLIFSNNNDMLKHREIKYADSWPRTFFLSFPELFEKMMKIYPEFCDHFPNFLQEQKSSTNYRLTKKISLFIAKVQDNIPVREGSDCKHYRIKFEAPELEYVVPGQFVMMDTMAIAQRKRTINKASLHIEKSEDYVKLSDLSIISFLKRPFSIHRAFYKHFEFPYLKNIFLPPNLAAVTHTVFPNRFEVFYKVLDSGVGTNELKNIKAGDELEMIGPLGSVSELANLRSQGVTEIHLIGGGVGMAPLVFFGQALKFYSFQVKAFIGIDRFETLLFSERFAPSYSEDNKNAYVYIDNLLKLGLNLSDIYLSTEDQNLPPNFRLNLDHWHAGFVSDQYEKYLKEKESVEGILVIACGPESMLRTMENITTQFNIPMKVLLEKRMACGIGVCMSCVCKTKKDGSIGYSRVCTDGPIFDVKNIVWGKK